MSSLGGREEKKKKHTDLSEGTLIQVGMKEKERSLGQELLQNSKRRKKEGDIFVVQTFNVKYGSDVIKYRKNL